MKVFLILVCIILAFNSNAQFQILDHENSNAVFSADSGIMQNSKAIGDTMTLSHFPNNILVPSSGLIPYSVDNLPPYDSGYLFGSNAFDLVKEYAERYEISGLDSSVKVIGAVTLFSGTYNQNSNKNIVLKVWSSESGLTNIPGLYFNGSPKNVLSEQKVSIKNLGIRSNPSISADTFKTFYFSSPTEYLSDTFYIGYEYDYNWNKLNNDIIGLYSTNYGIRNSPLRYQIGSKSITNTQNMYRGFDNKWYDIGTDYVPGPTDWPTHLAIWPIVIIGFPSGVHKVKKDDLIFYGSYPNPTIDQLNVKFNIEEKTDMVVDVLNSSGEIVFSIKNTDLPVGDNVIQINTAQYPAGIYTYILRTLKGGCMASQFTVIK